MTSPTAILADIVPTYSRVWKPTATNKQPPAAYCVYTSMTTEAYHADDHTTAYRTYIYLNLWTKGNPSIYLPRIRNAMYDAGYAMVEERADSYEDDNDYYLTAWTWVIETDAESDGDI